MENRKLSGCYTIYQRANFGDESDATRNPFVGLKIRSCKQMACGGRISSQAGEIEDEDEKGLIEGGDRKEKLVQ